MMVITLRRKTFIIGIITVRKRIIVHRNHNRIVIFDYFIKIIKFVENTGIVFLITNRSIGSQLLFWKPVHSPFSVIQEIIFSLFIIKISFKIIAVGTKRSIPVIQKIM